MADELKPGEKPSNEGPTVGIRTDSRPATSKPVEKKDAADKADKKSDRDFKKPAQVEHKVPKTLADKIALRLDARSEDELPGKDAYKATPQQVDGPEVDDDKVRARDERNWANSDTRLGTARNAQRARVKDSE